MSNDKIETEKTNDEISSEPETIDDVVKIARTKLSVRQKRELGLLMPKKPRTEKQKANDERLRLKQIEIQAQRKREKEEYEEAQLRKIQLQVVEKEKRKNKMKKMTDNEYAEYEKFLEFKKLKDVNIEKKVQKHTSLHDVDDDESDGEIQAKKQVKKANKIAKAVEEIDNKISKLQIAPPAVNPYLELLNKKKT